MHNYALLLSAGLAFKKGDTHETTRDVRTSSGTFMSRGEDPEGVLAWIEDKIAVSALVWSACVLL